MPSLTPEQKRDVCLIVSTGCARETASRYAGCRAEEVTAAAREDPAFAQDLARAEAGIELAHMSAVQRAARDERHWRASAWWLERQWPDRYARRNAGAVSPAELRTLMTKLSASIVAEVPSPDDRSRLLRRLEQLAQELATCELPPPAEERPDTANKL